MVIKNTESIIKKVALSTSVSEEVVKEVINHFFTDIRYWMYFPTSANYYLPFLGKFYSTRNNVDSGIRSIIYRIRKEEDPIIKEELRIKLRTYWIYRRNVIKEQQLKQYKKRFGKWHWKKETQM